MYCQVCGAPNRDDQEYCVRCHQKLLVLSGALRDDEEGYEESPEESFSFDEHLLERISILEEAVKRTAETVRQLLGALHKQEKNILINQTGLSALRELLEQKHFIGWEEWSDLWESKMDYQLLALEKRERFLAIKERIAALHHGEKRKGGKAYTSGSGTGLRLPGSYRYMPLPVFRPKRPSSQMRSAMRE